MDILVSTGKIGILFCQSKAVEGLDFRSLEDFNRALLAKKSAYGVVCYRVRPF